MRKLSVILSVTLLIATAFDATLVYADEVKIYECTAKLEDAGRDTGSSCGALMRWSDGSLRMVHVGGVYYWHEVPGQPKPNWIELYGVPLGHGAQLLGFLESGNFDCVPFIKRMRSKKSKFQSNKIGALCK